MRIVEAAEVSSEDTLVEIGAGLGDLTEHLAERAGRVVALEVDRDLCEALKSRFQGHAHVEVLQEDALHWPLPDSLRGYGRPRKVVGNLPYNVGTQILLRFMRHPGEMDLMAMMFQREVAQRLVASPGTPHCGGITALLQVHWEARLALRVPPGAFHPPPRVDSALVVFRPLPAPRVDIGQWGAFHKVVKAAFGQRRKTLRNALKGLCGGDLRMTTEWLKMAGVDGEKRGETLSLAEFASLSRSLLKLRD
jgi:16S rRNA (adenine1518-N6/adenine1519-N6)-dimethyltransferase